MRPLHQIFPLLEASGFRRRFHLGPRERAYLGDRGLDRVLDHARNLIAERLAPASPTNDGRQTPYRGHPVFVAQHATASCCRKCLEKWHDIPRGHPLTAAEQAHVVAALERWLRAEAG